MAAAGYCKDLFDLNQYITFEVSPDTEIHIIDFLSRYADCLLEEVLSASENSIIFNKKKYSNCKKKLSQIASNDEHQEFELAKLIRMDDVNAMAELVAKNEEDAYQDDESKIRLGEGCASVSLLARKAGDYELTKIFSMMAYTAFYVPFYNALSNTKKSKRYDFKGVEKKFNANSLSRCTKRIVSEGLCRDEESLYSIVSQLPRVLNNKDSIRFFKYKINSLDAYHIEQTYNDLILLETGQLSSPNITISRMY